MANTSWFSTPTAPPPAALTSENGLKIADSAACGLACAITVDSTLTSSSVTLSRDILGKLDALDAGAPSDDWIWDETVGWANGKPIQDYNRQNSGGVATYKADGTPTGGLKGFGSGNHYRYANPAVFGKDGIDNEGYKWMNDYVQLSFAFAQDKDAWQKDQDAHAKASGGASKLVYIWNPSNNDIVKMNTDTYGALTKLFLKPTLPFKVTFNDGQGAPSALDVTLMSVYHPCPIRIETVQYDAVLQIGDFHGLNGYDCTQVADSSASAARALLKQKTLLDKRIAALMLTLPTSGRMMAEFTQAGMKWVENAEWVRVQAQIDKLQAEKAALKLPTKRECSPKNGAADSIVIFIPLQVNDSARSAVKLAQTKFINAFANKIPNILGAQPDKNLGYPDVPAATQNDWRLSDVLNPDDCYYTWKIKLPGQTTPTTIVFMKNPIAVLSADMASIQRLPITPPSDVFHVAPTGVRFHSCPPTNPDGTPAPCKKAPPKFVPNPALATEPDLRKKSASPGTFADVMYAILGLMSILIGVWLAIWLATGPGERIIKSISATLGNMFTSRRVKPAPPEPSKPAAEPASPRPPPSPTEPAPTPTPKAPTPVAKPAPLAPIRIPPTTETGGGKPA